MSSRRLTKILSLVLTLGLFAAVARAQDEAGQDVLKVSVEEVRIPVAAYDDTGRFDPTLSSDDLLVREDGEPQRVTGVYRVPAHVLLLADTGGELNPSKTARLTGDVAAGLVSSLRHGDRVALMEVSNRAELIQDWTGDLHEAARVALTKLLSGKRSALAEGLARAAVLLQQTPPGNRHLVIISDGLDSGGGPLSLAEALKRLAVSGVTVHVISYTTLAIKAKRPPATRLREKNSMPEEGIMSLPKNDTTPEDAVPSMRGIMEAKGGGVVDLDRLFRRGDDLKKELARREAEFGELTAETGGGLWLPSTAVEMRRQAAAAAREIDSGYVVTYKPRRSLADAKPGEYRKLDVLARRQGLTVRSRRGYVAKLP
ncbi:MAG: VWA domain-containing protein [Pyrinomonadaceae bacterium]